MFGDFQSLKPNPDEHRIQPIEASHLAQAAAVPESTGVRGRGSVPALARARCSARSDSRLKLWRKRREKYFSTFFAFPASFAGTALQAPPGNGFARCTHGLPQRCPHRIGKTRHVDVLARLEGPSRAKKYPPKRVSRGAPGGGRALRQTESSSFAALLRDSKRIVGDGARGACQLKNVVTVGQVKKCEEFGSFSNLRGWPRPARSCRTVGVV